jgi:hypothetical protein
MSLLYVHRTKPDNIMDYKETMGVSRRMNTALFLIIGHLRQNHQVHLGQVHQLHNFQVLLGDEC